MKADIPAATPGTGEGRPSLKRNSASRFLADAAGLLFGVLSGVVTARGLGPSGKGLFSSLVLLSSIVLWVCALGLGDAAIVMVGQRKATVQQALGATVAATLGLAVVGAALLWGASMLAFSDDWEVVRGAAIVASATLPIALFTYGAGFLLAAQDRVVAQSAVVATTTITTTLGLVLFIAVLNLSLTGGVIANGLGSGAGLALATVMLKRSGLSFRLRLDRAYVTAAARYGLPVSVSYVLTVALGRVDMLIAYVLVGAEQAGLYSVSLALSALVWLLPVAISAATFPRLARVGMAEANQLIAQACRYGLVAATASALALAAAVPVALPLLFGREYWPAVGPTLVLLPGGVLFSGQWLLCRAAAARGRPGVLVRSYLVALVVMCGLDVALLPLFGIAGAAVAAVVGSGAGLAVCVQSYRGSPEWPFGVRELIPRPADVRAFGTQSLQLIPWRRSATSGSDLGG